jgi:hypothetical protein
MKKRKILIILSVTLLLVASGFAQKPAPKKDGSSKKLIYGIFNDGKNLEPIAFVEKGKLVELGEEASGEKTAGFVKQYYKPKTKYNVVFGGENVGTATVVKDFAGTDCAANQAEISVISTKFKPKGFLMGLATDMIPKKNAKLIRQLPTAAERAEINKLVMDEMKAKNVPIKNTGELRYHNLTKLDVDGDGNSEFVGTYWYNTGAKKRSLLFFIAEKAVNGVVTIPFTKFQEIEEKDVMNNDIKALDEGTYHELLLDMLDYDGDGQSEIFTYSQGFEGSNFNAYKRVEGKWTQVLETSNYHCAF